MKQRGAYKTYFLQQPHIKNWSDVQGCRFSCFWHVTHTFTFNLSQSKDQPQSQSSWKKAHYFLVFFNKRHVRSSDLFHISALLQHSSINARKNAFDMFDLPRGMTDCKRLLIRFTSEAQSWFVKSVQRCWSCVFCFQPFRFIKSL